MENLHSSILTGVHSSRRKDPFKKSEAAFIQNFHGKLYAALDLIDKASGKHGIGPSC
jgi:hypothetical protein